MFLKPGIYRDFTSQIKLFQVCGLMHSLRNGNLKMMQMPKKLNQYWQKIIVDLPKHIILYILIHFHESLEEINTYIYIIPDQTGMNVDLIRYTNTSAIVQVKNNCYEQALAGG